MNWKEKSQEGQVNKCQKSLQSRDRIQTEEHAEAVFITCGSITMCQFLPNQNTSHTGKISLPDVGKVVVFCMCQVRKEEELAASG